jgi:IclR family acetate operon transcriptional repressor
MTQAGGRLLRVLRVVAGSERPMGLVEISAAAGLDKSTAHRLLGHLCDEDMLVRNEDTRRYSVGTALQALGALSLQRSPLRAVTRPHLESLRDSSGETVTLHIPFRENRVCIDGVLGCHDVCRIVRVGETLPLEAGVTGKVLLAFSASLDAAALPQGMATARSRGYLAAIDDRVPGVAVIAAPIVLAGTAAGAIAVGGPKDRWTMKAMQSFAPQLRAAVSEISKQAGQDWANS